MSARGTKRNPKRERRSADEVREPARSAGPGDERGLLDTSVVVDIDRIDPALLPAESGISAVTLAELAAGPHATSDPREQARRQDRLQWAVEAWSAIPFDTDAARAYARVFAAARVAGRTSRTRLADLLIAATAAAHGLPVYTRNPEHFHGLDGVVAVVAI